MKLSSIVLLVAGCLLFLGGLFGFLKTGSFMSLSSGVVCGLVSLVVYFALEKWSGKKKIGAYWLAIAFYGLLATLFLFRFVMSGKVMPAGIVLILSLVTLFTLLKEREKVCS